MRGGDGAEVIYALRNNPTLSQLILSRLGQTGQNIRRAYQRQSTVNPSKDYYFMHRNTGNTESIIVEYGFVDSTLDDPAQIKQNWEEYAETVVQGVLEYIDYDYDFPTTIEYYTVQAGDSLYSIANKYGMTVDELKRLNNLSSNILTIGQMLKVSYDDNIGKMEFYEVKSGDTLYSIALKYNTTVDDLMKNNDLTSSFLQVGQVLKIPTLSSLGTYTVVAGDTLYSIAKRYGMTVDELKQLNKLTNNLLHIGQNLIVTK